MNEAVIHTYEIVCIFWCFLSAATRYIFGNLTALHRINSTGRHTVRNRCASRSSNARLIAQSRSNDFQECHSLLCESF